MSKKALMIGAGQIGRGFIGQMLADSGYEVVFLDIAQDLIDQINTKGNYQVFLLGEEKHPHTISGVRAVNSTSSEAVNEFVDATLVCTACGPKVLPKVAPLIADGLRRRLASGNTDPLDIIACENMSGGSSSLKEYVYSHLTENERNAIDQMTGFPNCEVSRIVVPSKDMPPLAVKVEKYREWIVDRRVAKSELTSIEGLELSDNVDAYVARKIFSLTGHAMLGYLGYAAGHSVISEAVYDYDIFRVVYGALKECGAAWSAKYGLPMDEFMDYCALMLVRFADQRVSDPVTRPAREPLRKLSVHERFFEPALTALAFNIEPRNIMNGVCAACCYDNPEDAEAIRLQKMIQAKGRVATVAEITGLSENHPLMKYLS